MGHCINALCPVVCVQPYLREARIHRYVIYVVVYELLQHEEVEE